MSEMLEDMCKLFGWQGGTIHQVIAEVKRLQSENGALKKENEELRKCAFEIPKNICSGCSIVENYKQKLLGSDVKLDIEKQAVKKACEIMMELSKKIFHGRDASKSIEDFLAKHKGEGKR